MKTLVQIIYVKQNAGTSKKTGNAYDMRMAQCVAQVKGRDGVVEPLVGELVLPQEFKDTQPGYYNVDFRLSVSQQKRIEAVVNSIEACDQRGNPLPAAKAPVKESVPA